MSSISCGIVGLPNVGKSTLFNALLKKQQALVANYPFATIEPNIGIVSVPDARLDILSNIEKEENKMENLPPKIPATVRFVDIAGLVKGANEGAGLGNKFLSHIREVSIIAHVVRAFADDNIIKEGSVDPLSDFNTIQTELMLADLETVQNTLSKMKRFQDPDEKSAVEKVHKGLSRGIPVRETGLSEDEDIFIKQLSLLTAKPEVIVLNVSENDYTEKNIPLITSKYAEILHQSAEKIVVISAKIEAELSELSEEEQKMFLVELGLKSSGLERLIQKAYTTLGLISFLTAGQKEVRAWTIAKGMNAQNAAGVIHTDFIKKFIKAEVVSFTDFTTVKGWKKVREVGKGHLEGKEYTVQDGDVIEFKIGS